MTLTFKVDPSGIQLHSHTKYHHPKYNTFRDMNFCLVTFCPVTDIKRCIRAHRAYAQVCSKMQLDVEVSTPANDSETGSQTCNLHLASIYRPTTSTRYKNLVYCGQVSSCQLLDFLRHELTSSLNFGQVTDRQTESDA